METPLPLSQRTPEGIQTRYSQEHLDPTAFCAADFAFQVGAVVINDAGHVLVVTDPQTGVLLLPVSHPSLGLGGLVMEPLRFVEDQTGLRVERLALLHADERYRNQDVQFWMRLEEDLVIEEDSAPTTNPFSLGLDVDWYTDSKSRSLRQSVISWYGGFVPGQPGVGDNHSFVPIKDAIATLAQGGHRREYAHLKTLALFEQMWRATKTRHA